MKRLLRTIVLAFPLAAAVTISSAAPLGPEFQVNTYSAYSQYQPVVAVNPAGGGFVVVWIGTGLGYSQHGVFGQRFDSAGMRVGSEFRINGFTASDLVRPSIAYRAAGEFVVVWSSPGQDGSAYTVMGRLYDSTGMSQGSEFRVNTYTTGSQFRPSVASSPAGDFVVVWEGAYAQDGSGDGIFGQSFDSAGSPVGGEFQVNTYTTGYQQHPAIASDGGNGFVVTWESLGQDGDEGGVFARQLDGAGSPVGSEFQVNTYTPFRQFYPSVSPDGAGGFVVVWSDTMKDGDYDGVFGRRYDSAGSPAGAQFPINVHTASDQSRPSVAPDGTGFFVVWSSLYQDGSYQGVFGRHFDSAGGPPGPEIQINTFTTADQYPASVSGGPQGGFVVVWGSYDQDGDAYGIVGRMACADSDGDGVCDVGDIVITSPISGADVDCSDPKNIRPTITWNPGSYDKFQIQIGSDPAFVTGTRVTSGSKLTTSTSYTPPGKKWKNACAKAVAANAMAPVLYLRISGVDTHVPKSSPTRKTFSQVVRVAALPI